jgi:hypothetical protein
MNEEIKTEKPEAQSGWQPMESAPKDGTQVIVWDGGQVVAAHFDSSMWGNGWVEWCYRSDADPVTPKLWMPLPCPPNANTDV